MASRKGAKQGAGRGAGAGGQDKSGGGGGRRGGLVGDLICALSLGVRVYVGSSQSSLREQAGTFEKPARGPVN